jgi:hypothetical protein
LKRTHTKFIAGNHVYLKVKPRNSSFKLGKFSMLSPQYCRPFEVISKVGPVAYQLALPTNLKVHNVFHVTFLKKYVHDITHIVNWNVIQVEPEGDFLVEPLCIINRKESLLRKITIAQVKVQWKKFSPKEAAWVMEEAMSYPFMFQN